MAKIPDYNEVANLTNGYVLGVQDDVVVRFAAETFKGDTGATGPTGSSGYTVTDLSSATSDFLLEAGSVAYINYSSATSVPLNIQTVAGLYEIDIMGDVGNSTADDDAMSFRPNNDATSNTLYRLLYNYDATARAAYGTTTTGFILGGGVLRCLTAKIDTTTANKTFYGKFSSKQAGSLIYLYDFHSCWTDADAWTSLGTIVFTNAQSGKIIVRRVI
jgi:hypothetical protein